MPAPPKLLAASAIFTVADVAASVAFYRDMLGFAVQHHDERPPGYAIVCRGEVSLHLNPAGRNDEARSARGKSAIYVWVDDVRALHDEIARRGQPIAVALCETPYGTREFAVRDPDGNGLSFAQNVSGR